MPLGIGIGAGLGILKSATVDKAAQDRDTALQAATARYSPWTGLKPQPVQYANPFNSALQFGATGGSMAQGIETNKALQDYLKNNPNAFGKINMNLLDSSNFGLSPMNMNMNPLVGATQIG